MSVSPENPWAQGNCCEGEFMQDAAHIWAAVQHPKDALRCIQQTEVYKWGEGQVNAHSDARIGMMTPDIQLCCDVYTLSDDLSDPERLQSFLEDMGLIDFIRELRPQAAEQIERHFER